MQLSFAQAGWSAAYEPNDNLVQAIGPLEGGVNYDVTQETANDLDWFYFYTPGQVQMKLTATHLSGQCRGSFGGIGYTQAAIQLFKEDGSTEIVRLMVSASAPTKEHVFTVSGAKKMYILVFNKSGSAAVGCTVRFSLSPTAAVTPIPAPDSLMIQSCLSAQHETAKLNRATRSASRKLAAHKKILTKTNSQLKRAETASRKRKLRAKARKARKQIAALKKKLKRYSAKLPLETQKAAANCTAQVLELIQNDELVLKKTD